MNESNTLASYREGLHISYSQIKSFQICPMKYALQYIAGVEPSHRPVQLVLGGSVHHALAGFYLHAQEHKEKMEAEKLFTLFRDRVDHEMDQSIPIRFDEEKDPAKKKALAHKVVEENLSVRALEGLLGKGKQGRRTNPIARLKIQASRILDLVENGLDIGEDDKETLTEIIGMLGTTSDILKEHQKQIV